MTKKSDMIYGCSLMCCLCSVRYQQGRRRVWKSGGSSSNVVGIICPPPVEIGLTDLPKSVGAMVPLDLRLLQVCYVTQAN